MIISEANIDNHSCLVLDPPIISPGAPVILILHGLGTNGDDMVPVAEALKIPNSRFVLPDAPLALPGYPEGSYAWYDFQAHDRHQIEESRDYLFKVMDRFSNDPNLRPAPGTTKAVTPVVIMGFSQGGVMAMEAGLNYKGKIAAIVSMSGYMPDPWATLTRSEAPFETPILLIHGTEDAVVPVDGSRTAVENLVKTGYQPIFREFPMGHTISEESLAAVREFLKVAASQSPG